jgi:GNAT superfamily N-acetyltransferase
MTNRIVIREMALNDCEVISLAFAEQGWDKPVSQYQGYFQDSLNNERVVLIAECKGQFAGYVTIVWDSYYPPYKAARIPEIMDFNVLKKYQLRGIGTALMDEAEQRIMEKSGIAGIGVGLTADYGAAQILYIKRGYIPDGRGIFQNGKHLKHGETVKVDDDLTLCLLKVLR